MSHTAWQSVAQNNTIIRATSNYFSLVTVFVVTVCVSRTGNIATPPQAFMSGMCDTVLVITVVVVSFTPDLDDEPAPEALDPLALECSLRGRLRSSDLA